MGEHHALGVAGRAAGEHELVDVVRPRAVPGPDLGLPVGREGLVRLLGQGVDDRGREPLEADLARIGCVAAGAQQETHGTRGRDDVRDGVGAHPRVEGDVDEARDHRAEVGRRQSGRGRRPGQDAVAGLEAERAQAPGRESAAAQHLRVAPVERGAVVTAEAERVAVPVPSGALLQEIEQGLHGAAIVPALPRRGKCRPVLAGQRPAEPPVRDAAKGVPSGRDRRHAATACQPGCSQRHPEPRLRPGADRRRLSTVGVGKWPR